MRHYVLEIHTADLESSTGEFGLILDGLSDDDKQEQTFALALVVITVVAGTALLGIGISLSFF